MHSLKTMADIEALEATPLQEQLWPDSSYALLKAAKQSWPDDCALSVIDPANGFKTLSRTSFSDLFYKVTQMANLLHELQIGVGDVTAYLLPNLLETHVVLWGAAAAGTSFPLSPLLSADHLVSLLNEAGVQVLVTAPAAKDADWDGWESLRPHLAKCDRLRHVLLAQAGSNPIEIPAEIANDSFAISSLAEGLSRQNGDALVSGRVVQAGDVASYFCTGGTTGLPKIAVRTHGAEAINACQLAISLDGEVGPGSKLLCGLPLFHVNAAMATGLTAWHCGAEVVLAGRGYRDPAVMQDFWTLVERHQINAFSAVPTILGALLDRPMNANVESLKFVICGAAPMATELFNRFEQATGLRILEGYGLTESMCTASINPIHGDRRVGSIGLRLPYEQMISVIVDDEGRYLRDCHDGEVGAIALAGPHLFAGYTQPEHEAGIWLDRNDGQRWFNTGDLGRRDKDGYFWLTGRRKELIIRGGHNIDPRLIEEALHTHPAVALAAAVGRPDLRLGEVPTAYVELRPGMTVQPGELEAYGARTISDRAAVPREVTVLASLPKTPVGKLSKIALVNLEIQRLIEAEAAKAGVTIKTLSVNSTAAGVVATLEVSGDPLLLKATLGQHKFATEFL